MSAVSRALIAAGIVLILGGLVWEFGGRFLHFGRLPGDIAIEKENFRFYFPLGTSIVLSVVVSLVLYLIRRLGGH